MCLRTLKTAFRPSSANLGAEAPGKSPHFSVLRSFLWRKVPPSTGLKGEVFMTEHLLIKYKPSHR